MVLLQSTPDKDITVQITITVYENIITVQQLNIVLHTSYIIPEFQSYLTCIDKLS